MENQDYNKNHPEYVPFSAAYFGHLIVGGIFTALAGISYFILSLFISFIKLNIQDLIVFIFLLVLISELIVTALQRPYVVKEKLGAPGGMGYALPELFVTPTLGFLGSFIFFQKISIAIFFGAILLIFCGINFVYLKPWKPGLSRKEVRDKYEQTKRIIRDDYLEEKYRDVKTDPDHEKLFKKH